MTNASKHVLVTGASTGIGYATVVELLGQGYSVFGSIRTASDAARLSKEFGRRFSPLVFDVTREEQVAAAAADVADKVGSQGLCGLVNNAGICRPGPLSVTPASVISEHLEINVMGVFNVTKAFLPSLGTRPHRAASPGRIINISSLSGRIAYPFMGGYAASKHALEALSDSWRRELMLYGIDLVVIQPGAIRTPIWDKASSISMDYADTDYGPILQKIDLLATKRSALPPEKVARLICRVLRARRPKARYVLPDNWLLYWIIPRMLPDRWLDRIIQRILGLEMKRDAAR